MKNVDILIIGAGPVGLLSAYLGQLSNLTTLVLDKSKAPLEVGRADALNARTLQFMEVINLFSELHPHGLPCNTSSIWENGEFVSRQSKWWDEIKGSFHKHFLMLGQSFVEKLLDDKLTDLDAGVLRETTVTNLETIGNENIVTLSNGETVRAKYIIGADGSRSFVRNHFKIPFEITRPEITWAVIDAVFETDFPKVPEIIVFQAETSDVAWIPREGKIDRFYVRMDKPHFEIQEAMEKINRAMNPHNIKINELVWFSQFSVKESVAESYSVNNKIFLAGDSCHIHSVNGGQGLNTGLADAFNLIWKIAMVENNNANPALLNTYEAERKPVAKSVIESSGELVRSTKYSETNTHAKDYVKIVEKRAGNITGMGIKYGDKEVVGSRVFDFEIDNSRLYSKLDYSKFTLLVDKDLDIKLPSFINIIVAKSEEYQGKAVLIRPDSYIAAIDTIDNAKNLINEFMNQMEN